MGGYYSDRDTRSALLYSPEVNCEMCVLSEAILVLFGRAAPEPACWVSVAAL